jgi:hypothetical protein
MRTTTRHFRIARHGDLEFECRCVHDYTEIRLKRWSAPAPVRFDLRAQRIHVVEPPFVAQPLNERQTHTLSVQIAGVSQQVRLDRRFVSLKVGRTPMFVSPQCTTPSIVIVVA